MKKILIIEDEQYISEMYKMKFEQEGFTVFTAANGEEGVRSASKVKPNVILLDLVMPKMDGFQVLEKLKSDKQTKDIKVYILSNLGQPDEINKGIEMGADGYLIKASMTPSQLVEHVQKVLTLK